MNHAVDELAHVSFSGAKVGSTPRVRAPRAVRSTAVCVMPAASSDAVGSEGFLGWLLSRGGLDPAMYRARPLHRRLPACLRALRVEGVEEAQLLLEREPWRIEAALSAVLVGVTEFFREYEVFAQLRERVLEPLATSRRGIQVWSAGCSDGAELYSVAMMLWDLGILARSELLGTDCRADALRCARMGVYDARAIAALPLRYRGGVVVLSDQRLLVREELRRRTRWEWSDLLTAEPRGSWDLILWRNVGIYLEAEGIRKCWERLVAHLEPGGVLVGGKAERPPADLPLVRIGPCIYRKGQA